ncbi:site-specific integrase [Clostridium sartagoforme]|uniref:Site-specific integrase n=1 Tax=Clostridium sartagoforme TaxID=84031 RepID=A0A4S2DM77_9CLOT|nr:site-specific integrase [Clostridium sartagoforme]TGY42812.1 site-specific integrase [Clostridium sartagoforme]
MNTIINEYRKERVNFFYTVINVPINNELRFHICIFDDRKDEAHPFTQYLKDRMGNFTLKNKSLNTIKNFHLTYIIRFLNFIYNDSETPIGDIRDLTIKIIEEFLDKFSQGELPQDFIGEWRSRESVERATYALSHFVYWLWWKKDRKTNGKLFNLKYIKEENFLFEKVMRHSKNGYSSKEIKSLINIVVPNMSTKINTREKVVTLSEYSISKLIELSLENDNMLTLGIVLGAYAGLRVGDITQLSEERIKGLSKNRCFGAYLELSQDIILRSDNIRTSGIKTKRTVPIYPGCTKAIYVYYQMHIEFLKAKGLYPNKYGALFLNNNGFAMTSQTYLRRFGKLNDLLDKSIKEEVLFGNIDAIQEEEILSNNKITPHSLRHYFKQLIQSVEPNKRIIQYYLAHKSFNSQDSYAFGVSSKEVIRECQNKLYMPIKGIYAREGYK